jgi:cytochrome c
MDSFELNKIAGAILGTLILVMGLGFVAELIYAPPHVEAKAVDIEVPDEDLAGTGGEPGGEPAVPFAVLFAEASVEKGASVAKKCAACHNFEAGAPNKVGPNLHGVIGRRVAAVEGFSYSDAMRSFGEGKTWSYEELFVYLEAPKRTVPGTTMAFAGLRKPGERADAIAYLRSVSPDAPPPPEPPAVAAEAGEPAPAPAEGAEPKTGGQ